MNKYLLKIAGIPGTFMSAARKDAVQGILANDAKSAVSGLRIGPNVSGGSIRTTPRVVQNRTGMNRSTLKIS